MGYCAAMNYSAVAYNGPVQRNVPGATRVPSFSEHAGHSKTQIVPSRSIPRISAASRFHTQNNNVEVHSVASRLFPGESSVPSRATETSSDYSESESASDELPSTIAESYVSQDQQTVSIFNAVGDDSSNIPSEQQLVGDAIISISSGSDVEQGSSGAAVIDMTGRDIDGISSRISLDAENVVPTKASTSELVSLASPGYRTGGNPSRKRRYADATDEPEDDSSTLRASSAPPKRQKMDPVAVDTVNTRQKYAEKKSRTLLPKKAPKSGTQGAARTPKLTKAVSLIMSTNAVGQRSKPSKSQAIPPPSQDQIADAKGKKRAYVEISSDSDQHTQATVPPHLGLDVPSPLPTQRKTQVRRNKRASNNRDAESSASTYSAAETDRHANTFHIYRWMERNNESDREKQQEQRKTMLSAMFKAKSVVIREAAYRNIEDYCTEESHPACCSIKLTHPDVEAMREELGWLPVNITYITEEEIHYGDYL